MNRESEAIVDLQDVSLEYRLYSRRSNSLRSWLISRVQRQPYQVYRSLWAVKNLSLQCRPGERLGIMGPNGAGKTSLLRVIAGIFPPTRGQVRCRGHVVPLLELGLGFNGDMTGMENVLLASSLLGKPRREALRLAPRILEFAELTAFSEVPLKYYSSGMTARLAFSIAMETEPDILLLDEVFAVGDIHWVRMAEQRIMSLLNRAKVVIMVSHNLGFLKQLCRRGLYLDRGEVVVDGTIDEAVTAFERQSRGPAKAIIDNRANSASSLHWRLDGASLHVRAEGIPLLGECWIGLYRPGTEREKHLGHLPVATDSPEVKFTIDPDEELELRLYRWTPGGETLEASAELKPVQGVV